jgi:uncharacterized damage-inducible protein DinB
MNASTVRLLADYTRWADERMFGAVAPLTPEQYLRDLGSSLKSVRDTVVHLVSAQAVWYGRWIGKPLPGMLEPAEYPDIASIRARRDALWAELGPFLESKSDADLAADLRYKNLKGEEFAYPLGGLAMHLANHSTYHRGQVTTLLRQLGAKPVATDLMVFLAARKG